MHSMNLKTFYTFLLVVMVTATPVNAIVLHPFYVSVTELSYNSKTRSFEISCKMFAEDIEEVLRLNLKRKVDLSNPNLESENNRLINDYMIRHFAVAADSKAVAYKFVGFEKDKESVYCYLEITNVPPMKQVAITNSVLHDFKKEQINIIHVTLNGNRKSTKMDYPKNLATFNF